MTLRIIDLLSHINPIYHTFNIPFLNIFLPSTLRPFQMSFSCRFTCKNFDKILTFFHSSYLICLPQFSRTMKFLVVKLFPIFSLISSINKGDHISQPYITNGNVMVLHTFFSKILVENREDKIVWTDKPQYSVKLM